MWGLLESSPKAEAAYFLSGDAAFIQSALKAGAQRFCAEESKAIIKLLVPFEFA